MNGNEEVRTTTGGNDGSPLSCSNVAVNLLTDAERQAIARVRRAGVRAPETAILRWARLIGPEAVLSARLCEIRAVANAF